MVVNFIGGGNWSALRKLPTCRKSLTNFVTYCCIEYTSPWTGFELTKLIGTEYTGSCKSNYHTITTMTTPDHFEFFIMGEWLLYDKYRLMHALFHIRIVIIPIWKNACINLFITYFSIELKTTKLTSHTHTKQWVIDISWGMITVLIWKKACIVLFIKRLDIMLSEFCPDICPWADIAVALWCLRSRMGKIDVITYKYVIISYYG